MNPILIGTAARLPIAQIVFDEGDYDHALACYFAAKDWVLETGAWQAPNLKGRINSPRHPQSPASCSLVPEELIKASGWTVTMDFFCDDDDAAIEWLMRQELPTGARRVLLLGEGEEC